MKYCLVFKKESLIHCFNTYYIVTDWLSVKHSQYSEINWI